MAWNARSGFLAAAVFWALIAVGLAFESDAADLFLSLAAFPVLLLLSIEQVRRWRRGKDEQPGARRDEGDSIAARFWKWYYGG